MDGNTTGLLFYDGEPVICFTYVLPQRGWCKGLNGGKYGMASQMYPSIFGIVVSINIGSAHLPFVSLLFELNLISKHGDPQQVRVTKGLGQPTIYQI